MAGGAAAALLAATPFLALAHDGASSPAKVRPSYDASAVSVAIGPDGNVLVRGAKVTSVSGSRVTATTAWDDFTLTWRLDTDSGTDFVADDGSDADLSDIDEGDTLSFSGSVDTDAAAFTVDADTVRDWSLDGNRDDDNRPVARFWTDLKGRFPGFGFFGHAGANVR
jgi:hypothetical protein